jgi:hypothetical protein
MSYKPSDFVATFGDVVGVLMPGAVAAYVVGPTIVPMVATFGLWDMSQQPASWVAFVVGSYFLGHLVFLLGAFLDYGYDPIRRLVRPRERDDLYSAATDRKKAVLGSQHAAINTYKYAKTLLGLRHEAAALEVSRLEAESKFFRSTTALLGVVLIAAWSSLDGGARLIGAAMLILSFWRYAERRWKSTQTAYSYVLVLHGSPSPGEPVASL